MFSITIRPRRIQNRVKIPSGLMLGESVKNSDHHASDFETKGTLEPEKILDITNKIN